MSRHLVIGEDSVYEIDDTCMRDKYLDGKTEENTKENRKKKRDISSAQSRYRDRSQRK